MKENTHKKKKQVGERYSPERCVEMRMAEAVRMEREVLVVVIGGFSRHDYGDYGAGSQGNGCYKAHRGHNLTSE